MGLDDQLDAHISFLNAILNASGNRFFIQLTQFVSAALRVSIRYINTAMNVDNTDITLHEKVFKAIKERRWRRCICINRAHFKRHIGN